MYSVNFSDSAMTTLSCCSGLYTDPKYNGLVFRTEAYRGRMTSCWYLDILIKGLKYCRLIGSYPDVTLEEAWNRTQLCQDLLLDCFNLSNPLVNAIQAQSRQTFAECWVHWVTYERQVNIQLPEKHFNDILSRGTKHLFPYLGKRFINEISGQDLANTLIHARQHLSDSTVRKTRQNLVHFYHWMRAYGILDENQAKIMDPAILNVLVPQRGTHSRSAPHPAISQRDLPRFVLFITTPKMLRVPGILPILFTLLTASRIGNVVGSLDKSASQPMEWKNLDSDFSTWTIPANNMKSGYTNGNHVVPLSMQATKVLRIAREMQNEQGINSNYVFSNSKGNRFDYRILPPLVERICDTDKSIGNSGFVDDQTGRNFHIHGLRSTFKTWGTDCGLDWTLTEIALHHQVDKLKYDRAKAINRRRKLMQQWADFCFSRVENRWLAST